MEMHSTNNVRHLRKNFNIATGSGYQVTNTSAFIGLFKTATETRRVFSIRNTVNISVTKTIKVCYLHSAAVALASRCEMSYAISKDTISS